MAIRISTFSFHELNGYITVIPNTNVVFDRALLQLPMELELFKLQFENIKLILEKFKLPSNRQCSSKKWPVGGKKCGSEDVLFLIEAIFELHCR